MIQLSKRTLSISLAGSALLQVAAITFVPILISSSTPPAPLPTIQMQFAVPLPPPPPPPAPPPSASASAPRIFRPTSSPIVRKAAEVAVFEAPEPVGIVGGIEGGSFGGPMGGVMQDMLANMSLAGLAPPPPPPPPPEPPQRMRVSQAVQTTQLLQMIRPDYPPQAKQVRLQGTVRLEVVVGIDGVVKQIDVMEGHPLLVPAAVAAVSQWRYRPAMISGKPVEVITVIEVNFKLE